MYVNAFENDCVIQSTWKYSYHGTMSTELTIIRGTALVRKFVSRIRRIHCECTVTLVIVIFYLSAYSLLYYRNYFLCFFANAYSLCVVQFIIISFLQKVFTRHSFLFVVGNISIRVSSSVGHLLSTTHPLPFCMCAHNVLSTRSWQFELIVRRHKLGSYHLFSHSLVR